MPKTSAVPQGFHLCLKLETYEGDARPFAGRSYVITFGNTTVEGTTTADGEVVQDLPGDFRSGKLRVKTDITGEWEIPLERWPLFAPYQNLPGTGGGGGPPPGQKDPIGVILGDPEQTSTGDLQAAAAEAAQAAVAAGQSILDQLNDKLKAIDLQSRWWNELGCRLSNLGFLPQAFYVTYPADINMIQLVRRGCRSYCTRREILYPSTLDDAELDVTRTDLNDLMLRLMKEHGEKEPVT